MALQAAKLDLDSSSTLSAAGAVVSTRSGGVLMASRCASFALLLTLASARLTAQEATIPDSPGGTSATTVSEAAPVALVFAVDTSRSLSPAELARIAGLFSRLAEQLPASTPAGLVAFDDEPRWVVPMGASPAAAAAAARNLALSGRFTLLHDALFSAARGLPSGGVLLLASDGRDENSATTVEDVAGLAATNQVRIVALGIGRRIDEKALRRLAWLTNGSYLGPVDAVDAAVVSATVDEGLTATREAAAAARRPTSQIPAAAMPAADPTVATPAPPPATSTTGGQVAGGSLLDSWLFPLLLLLAVLALAAGVLGALLWRGRSKTDRVRLCELCGNELPAGHDDCPNCAAEAFERELRNREMAPPGTARPMRADTAIFKVPFEQPVERTFVMQTEPLLEVREPGSEPRTYRLATEKAFAIGRDAKRNTLGIADPTLSARHFRIVASDASTFHLVDDASTNGTYINGERAKLRKLKPGDTITAGQVEFHYKLQQEQAR